MTYGGLFGRSRWLDSSLEQPKVHLEVLKPDLQTGDLWFSSRKNLDILSLFSIAHFLVRLGTRSPWSHVGMVLRRDCELFLIEASVSSSQRVVSVRQALLEEMAGHCDDPAAIVIARPLAFAGPDYPDALPENEVADFHQKIHTRVEQGFPVEYDWAEIVRIVLVLALGGLARRWRHRLMLGSLARLMPVRHVRSLAAADEDRISLWSPWRRWLGRLSLLSPAGMERRGKKQDPYTCAELVAELLALCDPYSQDFSLDPDGEDFLSPAVIAERIPLVILGRLQ